MRKLLLVIAMLVAFVATSVAQVQPVPVQGGSPLAQSATNFFIQASTSGVTNDPPNGVFVLGYNSQITLWAKPGVTFPANASSACAATTTCNNVKVTFRRDAESPQVPTLAADAKLLYVSPTQINLIAPGFLPHVAVVPDIWTYAIEIYRASDNAFWTAEVTEVYPRVAWPIVSYQNVGGDNVPLLVGSIYGWNGSQYVVVKTAHDGSPNPRTWGGRPTIFQLYLSGWYSSGSDLLSIFYSGTYIRDVLTYQQYEGVAVSNFEQPSVGWFPGLYPVIIAYVNQPPGQTAGFEAYILWAN